MSLENTVGSVEFSISELMKRVPSKGGDLISNVGIVIGVDVGVGWWDSAGYGVCVGVGWNTVSAPLWDWVSLGFSYILEFSTGVLQPIITRAIMIRKFS